MNLTKLNENLNNIQSLPNKPSLTAEELKQEFDKAPNAIKEYINEILTVELISILTELERGISTGESTVSTINSTIATMKTKLDGIEAGANKYSHPTSAGNKHIPSGGSSGQVLKWKASGEAQWGEDNNTTYAAATTSKSGLMSSTDKIKLDGIATAATKNTVENVLTSTSTSNALSAAQGRALKLLIDGKQKNITTGTASPSGGSSGDIYLQYFA